MYATYIGELWSKYKNANIPGYYHEVPCDSQNREFSASFCGGNLFYGLVEVGDCLLKVGVIFFKTHAILIDFAL